MTKEVLKIALEALELSHPRFGIGTAIYIKASAAIKEALAQPEQEPVAKNEEGRITWLVDNWPQNCLLYTTPPQRKPLTEQEIGAILEDINAFGTRLYTFARAIEAAHGIKE